MSLERLIEALGSVHAAGCRLSGWTVYVAESRRASLGTKDRETGGPHAPLTLVESLTARYS